MKTKLAAIVLLTIVIAYMILSPDPSATSAPAGAPAVSSGQSFKIPEIPVLSLEKESIQLLIYVGLVLLFILVVYLLGCAS